MDTLFQLRSKNDKAIKQLDPQSRELIRSLTSYVSQYEISRYELEKVRTDLIDKAHNYKKRNTTLFNEGKDVKAYATSITNKLKLDKISVKNLFLIEFLPMFGFFFMVVILVLHLFGLWFFGSGEITSIDVTVGYPIFMVVQYFSIVYLLYLERRYSIENKSRKNLGSFANIFLVLTVIQFISETPSLTKTLVQVNIFVLIGIILVFLAWIVYRERQTK